MSKITVKVPQQDGEIRITAQAEEPAVYPVKDGHVSVDDADVPAFLARIAGSELAGGSPAKAAKETSQ